MQMGRVALPRPWQEGLGLPCLLFHHIRKWSRTGVLPSHLPLEGRVSRLLDECAFGSR